VKRSKIERCSSETLKVTSTGSFDSGQDDGIKR
jgi:hypothetical protein